MGLGMLHVSLAGGCRWRLARRYVDVSLPSRRLSRRRASRRPCALARAALRALMISISWSTCWSVDVRRRWGAARSVHTDEDMCIIGTSWTSIHLGQGNAGGVHQTQGAHAIRALFTFARVGSTCREIAGGYADANVNMADCKGRTLVYIAASRRPIPSRMRPVPTPRDMLS